MSYWRFQENTLPTLLLSVVAHRLTFPLLSLLSFPASSD